MYTISRALNRRHQITPRFTDDSRIVGPQFVTCFMLSFWHLGFGGGF